jgi:hypothetical protein
MELSAASTGVLTVQNIPPGCTTLRFFLNGAQCHTLSVVDPPAVTVSVPLSVFDTLMRAALPSSAPLLQCYALDSADAVLTVAKLAQLVLPVSRNHSVLPASANQNRLVASTLHGPGDIHRWELPMDRFQEAIGSAVFLRVLFDAAEGTLRDKPSVTVQWRAMVTAIDGTGAVDDTSRRRNPPLAAWGVQSATTMVSNACRQSAFWMTMGPHVRSVALDISVVSQVPLVPGALRYVVYAAAADRIPATPPMLGELEEPGGEALSERAAAAGGRRLAVLVGVSKYTRKPQKRISDLEYADDDVVAWYTYLRGLGFECKVYGDEFSPCRRGASVRIRYVPVPHWVFFFIHQA